MIGISSSASAPGHSGHRLVAGLRAGGSPAFVAALLWLAAVAAAIQNQFGIFFETNDDVGMMMLAQGFGLTAQPTDLLLYSNRVQGVIASGLGWPFGVPGYSVYLFACLLTSLAAIVAAMTRFNQRFLINLAVVSALALRPIFSPQFTIIASLMTIAGALAIERYRRGDGPAYLWQAGLFIVVAYLMRAEAMMMLALLSLPLLVHVSLLTSRQALVAGALTIAVIAAAFWWDRTGYNTPAWAAYNAMDLPRAWFTDFAMDDAVLRKPDLLASIGWSPNDVHMIGAWWWFDPDVFSPEKLERLINGVGGLSALVAVETPRLAAWANQFFTRDMLSALILVVPALVFVPGSWRWRMGGTVVLFAGVTLLFSLAGRYDVTRILYPGLALIIVFGVGLDLSTRVSRFVACGAAVLSALAAFSYYVPFAAHQRAERLRALVNIEAARTDEVLFEWGGTIQYEVLYPAFVRREKIPNLKLYSLGSDQLAPYALSWWGGDIRRAVARFRSREGARVIALPLQITLLDTYCREHWQGRLAVYSTVPIGGGSLYHVSCPREGAEGADASGPSPAPATRPAAP